MSLEGGSASTSLKKCRRVAYPWVANPARLPRSHPRSHSPYFIFQCSVLCVRSMIHKHVLTGLSKVEVFGSTKQIFYRSCIKLALITSLAEV